MASASNSGMGDLLDNPSSSAGSLSYAPVRSASAWRRFRRVTVVLMVAMFSVAGVKFFVMASSRGLMLYHQHECLTYSAPADQVVFDSTPDGVSRLAGDTAYVVANGAACRRWPSDWNKLSHSVAYGHACLPWPKNDPVIFMHERQSPHGLRRLVVVERVDNLSESPLFIDGYDIATFAVEPGGLRVLPLVTPMFYDIDVADSVGPHRDIRIYAGQVDPVDASHFTIRYQSGGRENIADGELGDDGQVKMRRREVGKGTH